MLGSYISNHVFTHNVYTSPPGTSGHVAYKNIPAATYIFRVVAHTHTGERAVTRRIVNVIGKHHQITYPSDQLLQTLAAYVPLPKSTT